MEKDCESKVHGQDGKKWFASLPGCSGLLVLKGLGHQAAGLSA